MPSESGVIVPILPEELSGGALSVGGPTEAGLALLYAATVEAQRAILEVGESTSLEEALTSAQAAINSLDSALSVIDTAVAELQATGPGTPDKLVMNGTVLARADVNALYVNAPTYADNTAALAGGLLTGHVYKTATGEARVVVAGPSPDQNLAHGFEDAHPWAQASTVWPATGWNHLNPVVGGVITRDTTIKHTGLASMKCYTPARIGSGDVPKAHANREGWMGQPGSTFTVEFWMYLVSAGVSNWNNYMFCDFECDGATLGDPALAAPGGLSNFFGTRVCLNSSRAIKLDREYSNQADPLDATGRNVAAPLDTWFKVTIVYYCHSSAGSCTVAFDDVNVYTANNFNSLPTAAQINSEFGTSATGTPVFTMVQVGITANGSTVNPFTAYFDDVTIGLALP